MLEKDNLSSVKTRWLDFALFAQRWRDTGCAISDWCSGADITRGIDDEVNLWDVRIFAMDWLVGSSP